MCTEEYPYCADIIAPTTDIDSNSDIIVTISLGPVKKEFTVSKEKYDKFFKGWKYIYVNATIDPETKKIVAINDYNPAAPPQIL